MFKRWLLFLHMKQSKFCMYMQNSMQNYIFVCKTYPILNLLRTEVKSSRRVNISRSLEFLLYLQQWP